VEVAAIINPMMYSQAPANPRIQPTRSARFARSRWLKRVPLGGVQHIALEGVQNEKQVNYVAGFKKPC